LIFKTPLKKWVTVRSFGPLDEGPNPSFQGLRNQRETIRIQTLTSLTFLKESAVGFTLPEGRPKEPTSSAKIELDPTGEVQGGIYRLAPLGGDYDSAASVVDGSWERGRG
jgi:hypothetical protein